MRYECDNCDFEAGDLERVAAHLRGEPSHTMRDDDSTYTLGPTTEISRGGVRSTLVRETPADSDAPAVSKNAGPDPVDGASDAPHAPAAGIGAKLPRVRIEQRSADVNNIGVRIDGKELHGLRRVEVVFDAEDIPRVTFTLHADAVDIDADLRARLSIDEPPRAVFEERFADPARYAVGMGGGILAGRLAAGGTMAASMMHFSGRTGSGSAFAEKYLRLPPVARWTIVRALGILTGPAIDNAIDNGDVSGDYVDTYVYSAALHAGKLAELERALDEWKPTDNAPEPKP
jgi:hypothetical protein